MLVVKDKSETCTSESIIEELCYGIVVSLKGKEALGVVDIAVISLLLLPNCC